MNKSDGNAGLTCFDKYECNYNYQCYKPVIRIIPALKSYIQNEKQTC